MEEELKFRKEQLTNRLNEITELTKNINQELYEINKKLYELEPTITINDRKSGRTFTLEKNSYEISLKYPKVNPITGERAYGKNEFWTNEFGEYDHFSETGGYIIVRYSSFPDKEYVETYDGDYCLYLKRPGISQWSKLGYYWEETSSNNSLFYSQKKIPDLSNQSLNNNIEDLSNDNTFFVKSDLKIEKPIDNNLLLKPWIM